MPAYVYSESVIKFIIKNSNIQNISLYGYLYEHERINLCIPMGERIFKIISF